MSSRDESVLQRRGEQRRGRQRNGWVALIDREDGGVGARAKAAHEDLHAEDGEDELEGEDDAEDVGDGGHRLEERDDDEPHAWIACEQAQRAKHTQDAQRLERLKHGEELREKHEEGDGDDEEVEQVPWVGDVRVLVAREAEGDDLGHHFAKEEDCPEVVE